MTSKETVEKYCDNCKHVINFKCKLKGYCFYFDKWEPIVKRVRLLGKAKNHQGKYEKIGTGLGIMTDNKQLAYGDAITAVEQIMLILYPDGVTIEQYRDMLLMVRIMDKQCRIAKGDKKAFCESPFKDIAGYGLLGVGHE